MKTAITLPRCKSVIIRQMFVHFVLNGDVMPIEAGDCEDIRVTHDALWVVCDSVGRGSIVNVGECGAAYRFLMALLAVTPGAWLLTGAPRLLQRPMEELVETLCSIGGRIKREASGWRIEGRALSAKRLTIDCHRTSQFASALLLVAPKMGLEELEFSSAGIPSRPYIQMTRLCTPWHVWVGGLPEPDGPLGRVGDWSAALFWYATALIRGKRLGKASFELQGISLQSAQGDAVVAGWFARLGVESVETETGVRITAREVELAMPLRLDVADHPDVVPVLAAMAAVLPADITFLHTRNLRYKESDRVRQLAEQLAPFAEIERTEDSLRVRGRVRDTWPAPPFGFHTRHDHRLAMAFLLFGKDACLDETECLAKSYPLLSVTFAEF
ncbi:MAG: hypothetical protein II899_02650 [Bacteroidales bacterium]|nr:hypothetical protein [Bacteroidales bacterium]